MQQERIKVMREEIMTRVALPSDWIAVSELEKSEERLVENREEYMTLKYLPVAAIEADKIIRAISANTDIEIAEAYIKLSEDVFHLLLLVNDADYRLPMISYAKYICKNVVKHQDFDMHITFSALSEYHKKCLMYPEHFLAKHLQGLRPEMA